MATVNFVYNYPYCGGGEEPRFGCSWQDSSVRLNGCNVHPKVFNQMVPGCRFIQLEMGITNSSGASVTNRNWDLYILQSTGTWRKVTTFFLPESGEYILDCDIDNRSFTKFAVVPSSNPSSYTEWSIWCVVTKLTITEKLEVYTLSTGTYFAGVMVSRSGVGHEITEVFVNHNGALTRATDVLINVNGTLKSVVPVYSSGVCSSTDLPCLFSFTPAVSGTYRITNKRYTGDHEIRFYNADFSPVGGEEYFYDESFELTAGTLYYITLTHFCYEDEQSESDLQIYKEA